MSESRGTGCLAAAVFLLIGGIGLGCFTACFGPGFGLMALFLADRTTGSVVSITIDDHEWERTIDVEEVVKDWDEDWCDELPRDAVVTDRWSEKQGRYSREDRCEYWTPEWDEVDRVTKSGTGTRPRWPRAPDDKCSKLGCRRPGDKHEKYTIEFRIGSKDADCPIHSVDEWRGWKKGSKGKLLVGGVVGTPYCDTLAKK